MPASEQKCRWKQPATPRQGMICWDGAKMYPDKRLGQFVVLTENPPTFPNIFQAKIETIFYTLPTSSLPIKWKNLVKLSNKNSRKKNMFKKKTIWQSANLKSFMGPTSWIDDLREASSCAWWFQSPKMKGNNSRKSLEKNSHTPVKSLQETLRIVTSMFLESFL